MIDRAIEEALNVKIERTLVPNSGYEDKLNVLLASAKLPDLVQMRGNVEQTPGLPRRPSCPERPAGQVRPGLPQGLGGRGALPVRRRQDHLLDEAPRRLHLWLLQLHPSGLAGQAGPSKCPPRWTSTLRYCAPSRPKTPTATAWPTKSPTWPAPARCAPSRRPTACWATCTCRTARWSRSTTLKTSSPMCRRWPSCTPRA